MLLNSSSLHLHPGRPLQCRPRQFNTTSFCTYHSVSPLRHNRSRGSDGPHFRCSAQHNSTPSNDDQQPASPHAAVDISAAPDAAAASSSSASPLRHIYTAFTAAVLAFCFFQGRVLAAAVGPATAVVPASPAAVATVCRNNSSYAKPVKARQDIGLKDALQYRTMQLFALPAVGKVLAVVAVALPIVMVGGLLYRKAAGDCSWPEALGRTYSVLNNCPGSSVESERNLAADVVLHLVYLAGLFTFAVVLGIITDDISTHVEKVRKGNHPVIEQNHTVVLNWNQQTLPVLQQISRARHESGGTMFNQPIVVLADKDKDDMDEQVAKELEGLNLNVVTRSGNPAKPSEQRRASLATADTVVLMWPSDLSPADASAQQAAVLAALKTSGGVVGQKIVVQSAGQEVGEYDAVQMAVELAGTSTGSHDVASLTTAGNERINQIMAQVANQPGLEDVFADLLEYEDRCAEEKGAEFYMDTIPEHLEGRRFQEVRRCYPKSTVVGWISPTDHKLHLNSKDTTVVPAGSQLVFVAGSRVEQTALKQPYEVDSIRLGGRRGSHLPARNITMLCFSADAAESALKSIMEFSPWGSRITLVCNSPDVEALTAVKRRGVRLNIVNGNPSSRSVLAAKAARLQQAHTVVLCGLEDREQTAADMQVVASVLQLQKLASEHKKRKQPLAIVATLNSTATEDVLWHTTLSFYAEQRAAAAAAAEEAALRQKARSKKAIQNREAAAAAVQPAVSLHLLRPDELMSGMLTQTACAPRLAAVFSELFAKEAGHEIYLRDPRRSYGIPHDKPMLWKDVAELARKRREIAIGYKCSVQDGATLLRGQAEVSLGVHADAEVRFRHGDKVVVIALQ